MGDGIRLYAHNTFPGPTMDWHEDVLESWDENPVEYIAYPADVARARERVVEAAQQLLDYIDLGESTRATAHLVEALREALRAAA